ncbi:organomercurial transporter MerC [Acidihalobacter ferrooxydans]|uniref:Mercuric resistance protein MerC n=1 Tax=Acidihalobacter ferrooxydans TaxID=1765967 RepID=A0A1P8UFG2_9GAMM|nr:organomercurial transporter MerC [Acidihalobacter ferrooxydans]APZ42585.1 Mercuric resistance protein MerC [Acidihalobacter ferrooxydans]
MSTITRIIDKTGAVGAIVGSFSCAMCFPAAASLGAAIGLGFLSQWEGLFVHWLIPIFAGVALLATLAGWFSHRQWRRTLLGSIGPVLALIGVFGLTHHFLAKDLARGIFYTGLIVMFLASIWDMINPANRRCATDG